MSATTERFTWTTLWDEGTASAEWSHSGIAALPDGRIVFAAPEGGDLIVLDPMGRPQQRIKTPLLEIHGITIEAESDVLLLADPGLKPRPRHNYREEVRAGATIRFSLTRGILLEFRAPEIAGYSRGPWRPTSAAVDTTGAVWIADGYGQSLVHRFSATGAHMATIDGSESGRAFDCPHGLMIDRRNGAECVVVADRGNRRLVTVDLQGRLLDVIEHPLLTSPSSLAARGDTIVITELYGGLLEVGADDSIRPVVLPLASVEQRAPWPNAVRSGQLIRPRLEEEQVHSPHGVAVGADGSIYLTEWLIGGRQIRLQPHDRVSVQVTTTVMT